MANKYSRANEIFNKFINCNINTKDNNEYDRTKSYIALRKHYSSKLSKEQMQRILPTNEMLNYIKGILPELLKVVLDNGGKEVLIVEDVFMYYSIKTIFEDILRLDKDDFNLYYISAEIPMKDESLFNELEIKMEEINNRKEMFNEKDTSKVIVKGNFNMKKFDAIIGNPPYAYINSAGKNQTGRQFWHDFAKWSFEHVKKNGVVSLITPDNWLNSNQYNNLTIRNGYDLVSTGKVKFSDASVSARYWTSIKKPYEGTTDFDGEACDMSALPYYPLDGKYVSIFEKVFDKSTPLSFKEGTNNRNAYYGNCELSETNDKKYPIYFSNSMIKYSENASNIQDLKKVLVSSNSSWKPWYDGGINGCDHHVWYKLVNSEEEGKFMISYLTSKIVNFIFSPNISIRRQDISKFMLKNIPIIPLDKHWTDEELYKYFELTDEEIKMIEEVVK